MEYEQVALFVKIGGTIFFFVFFAIMIVAVFWRDNSKTLFGSVWPPLAVFAGISASIFIAAWFGGAVLLVITFLMIAAFVYSLRFFKSVNDDRFGGIAGLPMRDDKPIIDEVK